MEHEEIVFRVFEYGFGHAYKNEELGNLSHSDALDLIDLTTKLYMKIYSKYKKMEEFTMRMVDQSLELATDKYEKTVEELEEENTQLKTKIQNQKNELSEMTNLIHDLQQQIKALKESN